MGARVAALARRHPVIVYALLTYAITWILVLPLILNGLHVTHWPLPPGWHALGALGPITAAFVVAHVTEGRKGVDSLLRSMGRWRVGWFWWLAGVGSPLLLLVLSVGLVGVWSHQWPNFHQVLTSPSAFSFFVVDGLLVGAVYGVGEEPGWRGFALPRLQSRWNALIAALLVFVIWAIFHTPFFFYRYTFGLGSLAGFLMGLLAGAFWLTYLYNSTGGSVLITMLWHALFNVANAIGMVADPPILAVMSVLVTGLGILALIVGKPTRLSSPHPPDKLRVLQDTPSRSR